MLSMDCKFIWWNQINTIVEMFVTSRFFFAIKRLLFELQKQTLKDILQNKEQTTDKWFRDNFKWFTKQFCGKSQ